MAKYSNTKAKINEKITTNGAQAVTGIILNDVLQTMVDSLGADYQFGGLVQPGSSFTAGDQPVVFLATTPGTYTNFGGLVVADGEVALLVWSGSAWSKQTPDIATRTEVGQLDQLIKDFIVEESCISLLSVNDFGDGGITISNGNYQGSNGVISTLPGIYYRCPKKIIVKDRTIRQDSYTWHWIAHFYDINKDWLSQHKSSASKDKIITAPDAAYYVKFTFYLWVDSSTKWPNSTIKAEYEKSNIQLNVDSFVYNNSDIKAIQNTLSNQSGAINTINGNIETLFGLSTINDTFDKSDAVGIRRVVAGTSEEVGSNGNRVRACFAVKKGDILSCSCSVGKGVAASVFDTLNNAYRCADTHGLLQIISWNYVSSISEAEITADGYLTISLCKNDSSNISDAQYEELIDALNVDIIRSKTVKDETVELDSRVSALESKHYGIFDFNDKDYYIELIKQSKAPMATWQTIDISPQNKPRLSLLHFSDLHGDTVNYSRIVEFANGMGSNINDVLSTGDAIYKRISDDFSWWTNNKILNLIGNHEARQANNDNENVPQGDCYDKYLAPFISNWGVVQPSGVNTEGSANYKACYYYKDYQSGGSTFVRLIVLDALHYIRNVTGNAQGEWFADVLANAVENHIPVIVAEHYIPQEIDWLRSCTFCSLDMKGDGSALPASYHIDVDAVQKVNTFINNGGEFVCWLCGHTHQDVIGTLKDYPNQLVVDVTCASHDAEQVAFSDSARTDNTEDQDAFNILTFDFAVKTVKVIRVGNKYDRYLRHKGTLCYRYADVVNPNDATDIWAEKGLIYNS